MAVVIDEAGVDTWSPAWYVDEHSHTASALRELATVKVGMRDWAIPDPIGGYRVGWSKIAGLMWVEGHPAGDRLGCPDALPEEFDRMATALDDFGLPAPRGRSFDAWTPSPLALYGSEQFAGFAGVRRLDATVNFAADTSSEGLAILAGVAALARDAPRTHAELRYSDAGRLQTVYFRGAGGKKVLGRWYDKGVESSAAPLGQLLRAEDQRRFVKASRRQVEELTGVYVRDKFRQRFQPLWEASKGVTVAGPFKAADKLLRLVDAGEITGAQAERMAGHLLLGELAERTGVQLHSKATARRRRRELRIEAGVSLADGILDEVEVDVHDVLERALETDAWERRG